MRTLYGITVSPWTEKARWALDHHGLAYEFREHLPILGELSLRVKANKARDFKRGDKATVPLLVDGDAVLASSQAIARHADRVGGGDPLFPKEHAEEVERWVALSDRIIDAGRAKVLDGLLSNRRAQIEALPSFIPDFARGLFTPMASMAARFLASKHEAPKDVQAAARDTLRPGLLEVRKARGDRDYLLGRLTFADLAIASALRVVRPEATAPFGPGTREIWTNEELAAEFTDLLAWRDALYARHRKAP
ncbi:MAG: glutathione S-transferase [Deltaproteobacteria bacterium]|nr:glutathione S-transferase [Deltaproteobacteria bacterium]